MIEPSVNQVAAVFKNVPQKFLQSSVLSQFYYEFCFAGRSTRPPHVY